MTPAFAERVRRLRDRRRLAKRTTTAVIVVAAVVAAAVFAVDALWPRQRVDFVSPPAMSPSPTAASGSPSPSTAPTPSEPRSEPPTEAPPSEATGPSETAPSEQTETLTADTRIDLYGIGPIEAGMTLAEAEQAAGLEFTVHNFADHGQGCFHATVDGLEEDFIVMVLSPDAQPLEDPRDGVVARVSATFDMESPAETLSGVAVGDTEQEVYDTYAGQIESAPHVYIEGGHYLTYVPRDESDQDFRVRFFTDGQVVREIHAGETEATGAVEGCA